MDWQYLKVQLSKKIMPRRFYQFNPTKIPFVARLAKKALMDGDDMLMMPRDKVIQVNKSLAAPVEEFLPTEVIAHFVKKASYICILDTCLCREALKCKHYPISPGCIYMGEGARGLNPKEGRPATVDEALEHIHKSQELGLVSMVGRSKLDCVTHSIGPGNRLMAVCNCCPCCCIARGIPYMHPLLGEKFNIIPGLKIVVTDRCQGCGACAGKDLCIFQAFSFQGGLALIDYSRCRGCGRCVSACPDNAIEVVIEDKNYIKNAIERLSRTVNVT